MHEPAVPAGEEEPSPAGFQIGEGWQRPGIRRQQLMVAGDL
jgi:hypothetical protein